MSTGDWKNFINPAGDFELPNYLFRSINELMKYSLDMGNLLSDDDKKLRSYKEQVKKNFKAKWRDIAEALAFFEIITPCGCTTEYCTVCNGSRYTLHHSLAPDEMREVGFVLGAQAKADMAEKLHTSLMKVLSSNDL